LPLLLLLLLPLLLWCRPTAVLQLGSAATIDDFSKGAYPNAAEVLAPEVGVHGTCDQ